MDGDSLATTTPEMQTLRLHFLIGDTLKCKDLRQTLGLVYIMSSSLLRSEFR
jgi:hypothetical protein